MQKRSKGNLDEGKNASNWKEEVRSGIVRGGWVENMVSGKETKYQQNNKALVTMQLAGAIRRIGSDSIDGRTDRHTSTSLARLHTFSHINKHTHKDTRKGFINNIVCILHVSAFFGLVVE